MQAIKDLFNNIDEYFRSLAIGNGALFYLTSEYVQPTINDFRIIVEGGNHQALSRLLQHSDIDPSYNHNWAIMYACFRDNVEMVRVLLQDPRVDPSTCKNRCLGYAAASGCIEIVKILLEDPRVDPTDDNNHAIKISHLFGHEDVYQLLLEHPKVQASLQQQS